MSKGGCPRFRAEALSGDQVRHPGGDPSQLERGPLIFGKLFLLAFIIIRGEILVNCRKFRRAGDALRLVEINII